MTELLTLQEHARFFGVNRNAIKPVLECKGAKRIGSRYQLPVVEMPLPYWQERGLIAPTSADRPSEPMP
jgi:hypothetical protein